MSKNNDKRFNDVVWKSGNSKHITPFWLYQELDNIFHFDLDAATDEYNPQGTSNFFTPEDDALIQEWFGSVWLNPPYSRKKGEPEYFIDKAYEESRKDNCQVVVLLASRSGNSWMHELVFPLADGILFFEGRLTFEGEENSAPFDSMLALYGMFDYDYISKINKYGFYVDLKKLRTGHYRSEA